jgi:predicted amidohydrolase YtcJ
MQKMGVDYHTPDPVGGSMTRSSREKKLTGRMIENANVNALQTLVKLMPAAAGGDPLAPLLEAEKVWLANGQTTICEGRTGPETVAQIRQAAERGLLKGDFIVLPDYDANKDSLAQLKTYYRTDTGHFKIGAVKMTFDGSPQGKSAWLTQPYLVPPEGENKNYRGHAIYTRQAAFNGLADIFKHGMVAHIHVNGDAAIDEALTLLDSLQQQGLQPTGAPVVLVHTQLVRKDQVEKIRQLGLMPSWFPTHCYLWGDWYLESVTGLPRAAYISPLADGLRQGIRFTIHHDAPVTPPDLITAVYAAVNRTTRSGKILGADQRISAYEALKAITIHAAYQWGEEKLKGSLLQGKRADLVILDSNPVKVEPSTIRNIQVMATVKDGETVYEKPH